MAGKFIDATLRLIDQFTKPLGDAIKQMEYSAGSFTKAGKKIQKTGKDIENVGKSITASVTAPLIGLGTMAVKTAAEFEAAMSNVQAISGASASEIEKLSQKAEEMGKKTKFSASESADAFSYMAMAGWKTQDMLDGIEGIMYLAGATGEELATTSDIVTDALTAFGMSASDTNRFVDVMAKTASNANTDVSLMGETFKYVAPAAGALGYSVEDTAVAIGLMANSSIKGSLAGTALNNWLTRMAKPTKESGAAMDALGISLTDSEGNMKSFSEVISDTRSAFAGLTQIEKESYAAMLAGKTGMNGLLAVVNASDSDFNKLTSAISSSTGAAKEMYDVANNNLTGRLTVLKSTLESVAITFGERLMPYVEKGVGKLQELADKFSQLSDEQVDQIIHWAGIAAAVGPTILLFGKFVTGVGAIVKTIGTLGKGISALSKAFGTVKTVMSGFSLLSPIGSIGKLAKGFTALLSPAGAVIAVLGAVVAAGILIYKNWDTIKEKAGQFGERVKSIFLSLGIRSDSLSENIAPINATFSALIEKISQL